MVKYSIFIVDDEETIRKGITMAFDAKYQMSSYSNAEDAIEAFEKEPPDMVLLDIGLPGLNGIEALRRMKEVHPDVLFIMILIRI